MFQRGQKIVILQSSAKARSHPNVGDVGYLNNMYLFLNHRFILIDALFFSHLSGKNGGVEKKKFIIDLGMKSNLRHKIAYLGVPSRFFICDKDIINLSSTGYCIKKGENDSINFLDFPHIHSSLGIWPTTAKINNRKKGGPVSINKIKDRSVKIPFGQIALLSSKSNSKYRLDECNDTELQAWLRTAVPMIVSLLSLFCDYRHHYPMVRMNDSNCFNKVNNVWRSLDPFISLDICPHNIVNTAVPVAGGERGRIIYGFNLHKTSGPSRISIIKDVNLIKSIANIFLHRLDSFNINKLAKPNPEMDRIKDLWSTGGGFLSELKTVSPLKPIYHLIRSVIFRTIFLGENPCEKLRPLTKYFPVGWEANLKQRSEALEIIKNKASGDSSALARIYEVIK